jgi:hypothetical protein
MSLDADKICRLRAQQPDGRLRSPQRQVHGCRSSVPR